MDTEETISWYAFQVMDVYVLARLRQNVKSIISDTESVQPIRNDLYISNNFEVQNPLTIYLSILEEDRTYFNDIIDKFEGKSCIQPNNIQKFL